MQPCTALNNPHQPSPTSVTSHNHDKGGSTSLHYLHHPSSTFRSPCSMTVHNHQRLSMVVINRQHGSQPSRGLATASKTFNTPVRRSMTLQNTHRSWRTLGFISFMKVCILVALCMQCRRCSLSPFLSTNVSHGLLSGDMVP